MYTLQPLDKQFICQIVGYTYVQDDDNTVIERVMRRLVGLTKEQEDAVRIFVIETHSNRRQ